jgi:hypothetical protein
VYILIFFIKIVGEGSEVDFSATLYVTVVYSLHVDDCSEDVLQMSATTRNIFSSPLHRVSRDTFEVESKMLYTMLMYGLQRTTLSNKISQSSEVWRVK